MVLSDLLIHSLSRCLLQPRLANCLRLPTQFYTAFKLLLPRFDEWRIVLFSDLNAAVSQQERNLIYRHAG